MELLISVVFQLMHTAYTCMRVAYPAMAECRPPSAKKAKRSAPVSRVTAQERAKQFQEDLYVSDGVLFCKFCEHSVDFVRVDTKKTT